MDWGRQCAGWLTHLHTSEFPPRSTCAPTAIIPTGRCVVADLPRVAAILQRIAADVDELAAPVAWPTSARRLPSLTGGPNGGAG